MKKMKFFVYLAAIVAVTSAFATRQDNPCFLATQYHWNGSMYLPAGVYGEDFDCDYEPSVTCTYWRPNPITQPNVYQGCRLGFFNEFGARKANNTKAK